MNLSLKQLHSFIWVADLGSFGKAAERLHTTQPSISARIAALEKSLGVVLMERDAGSVRLTAKGIELLEYARTVIADVDRLLVAANTTSPVQGVLKIGITELVVQTWLHDFLRLCKQRQPNVVVELTVDLAVNLEYELQEKKLDLVVSNAPFTFPCSGEVALGTYPLVWVVSPDLGFEKGQRVSSEELCRHAILTHAKNTKPYQELNNHFSQQVNSTARLVPSTNLSVCNQMAQDGFGVASLLAPVVHQQLLKGQLIQLDYDWLPTPLDFFARYDAKRASQTLLQAVDVIKEVSDNFDERYQGERESKE